MKYIRSTYMFVACSILFILDRWTKLWALYQCVNPWYINQFFSCELAFNRGISWSMFSFADDTRFFVVTGVIVISTCVLIWYALKQYQLQKSIAGELLVITGSISNIIDRLVYGGVIDFLVLSYKAWSWPVFNIADICIVSGVVYMIVQLYISD